VGLFIDKVCFLPKTLNSAEPSFSIPLTQPSMIAGVAAISMASAISPKELSVSLIVVRQETNRRLVSDLRAVLGGPVMLVQQYDRMLWQQYLTRPVQPELPLHSWQGLRRS
jgi:hypothetical protein